MKKLHIYFLLLCVALCPACDKNDDEGNTYLYIVKSELNFEPTASTGYIVVAANGRTISAQSSESWCTAECLNDSVRVSVETNPSIEGRTALLTITDGISEQRVPVSQYGGIFRHEGESTFYVDDILPIFFFGLVSSYDYDVLIPEDVDWILYRKDTEADFISFLADENNTGMPRYTQIEVACSGMDKSYYIDLYQYSLEDLIGKWNAEWQIPVNSVLETRTGNITIKNADNGLEIEGLYGDFSIKAEKYETIDFSSFAISTNQYLGEMEIGSTKIPINLYGGILESRDNNGKTVYSVEADMSESQYICRAVYTEDRGITFVFDPYTTASGKKVSGIVFGNESGLDDTGSLFNLKLYNKQPLE